MMIKKRRDEIIGTYMVDEEYAICNTFWTNKQNLIVIERMRLKGYEIISLSFFTILFKKRKVKKKC
jgi:hypothetical protein